MGTTNRWVGALCEHSRCLAVATPRSVARDGATARAAISQAGARMTAHALQATCAIDSPMASLEPGGMLCDVWCDLWWDLLRDLCC
jgi:hypothetical protein